MSAPAVDKGTMTTGLHWVAAALPIYALSSALCAASAGLYALAFQLRDLWWNPGEIAGFALVAGGLLAIVALALLVAAYRSLRKVLAGPLSEETALLTLSVGSFPVAFGFLALAAIPGVLPLAVKGVGTQQVARLLALFSAASASAFLVAVLLPLVHVATREDRWIPLVGGILGIVGIMGEAAVTTLPPGSATWWALGGYPLVNWNLPFGSLVALAAFVLWRGYRRGGYGRPRRWRWRPELPRKRAR